MELNMKVGSVVVTIASICIYIAQNLENVKRKIEKKTKQQSFIDQKGAIRNDLLIYIHISKNRKVSHPYIQTHLTCLIELTSKLRFDLISKYHLYRD